MVVGDVSGEVLLFMMGEPRDVEALAVAAAADDNGGDAVVAVAVGDVPLGGPLAGELAGAAAPSPRGADGLCSSSFPCWYGWWEWPCVTSGCSNT